MILTPDQAAEILLAAVIAIVTGAVQAPVVEPAVNLIKWITTKLGVNINPNAILFTLAGLVTVLVWVSRRLGFEVQLDAAFGWLATIVPIVLTLLTTLFGSKAIYNASVARDVPLFGYARTPEVNAQTGISVETEVEVDGVTYRPPAYKPRNFG